MTQTLNSLVLFAILAINTAVTFLIAHAVIPSLVTTGDAPTSVGTIRRTLYFIFAVSFLVAGYAGSRALGQAITLIDQIYPRFVI
ncbi:MAG: hypothetical protein EXR58_01610 [Chloroflexi bacterium]|nr:hypothetical protein [Chloroflexota bacterium]